MKAIYTKIADKYYRINQETSVPTRISSRVPGATSSVKFDSYNKIATQIVNINNLEIPGTKTNRELVNMMKKELEDNKITQIDSIVDVYKIHIDYTVFADGKEIDHNIQIKPISYEDLVILLGVGTNDENVFRRVKNFKDTLELRFRAKVPFGLIQKKNKNICVKINDISIYQCIKDESFGHVHNSIYETPYSTNSSLVRSELSNSIMIYSSLESGIEFEDLVIPFLPNRIEIMFSIILTDYIVVYDDTTIDDIIKYNIEQKYNPESPTPPEEEDPPIIIPDEDDKTDADGDYTPDEDGYYDYYERCQETTPNSLLVVEDLISDGSYNVNTMIKKSKVIKDIPDIEIGEYVIYRESIQYDF